MNFMYVKTKPATARTGAGFYQPTTRSRKLNNESIKHLSPDGEQVVNVNKKIALDAANMIASGLPAKERRNAISIWVSCMLAVIKGGK